MKNLTLLALLVCTIFISSCSEQDVVPAYIDSSITASQEREVSSGRKLKQLPSSFTIDGRVYEVKYNNLGLISTITAKDGANVLYQYVAHYEGEQLVSADLVENGVVMSSNTNFEFDANGNVTGYDYVSYFFPEIPEGLVQHYTLNYNADNQLSSLPDGTPLLYDRKGNVVSAGTTSYRYESALNPLGAFPDLWLILVEESGYALMTLSPNIATTKVDANGVVTGYINEYGKGRTLLSQSYLVNGQTQSVISFTY